jgi:hypothetical protein
MGKFVREQQPILLPVLMGTKPFASGYIVEHNEMGEVIHNSEKLAEDLLPVTCPTCRVIWYHTHEFTR